MDSSLDSANERKGRVWSRNWIFEENTSFDQDRSNNGSVYAVVPGGRVGHDAVIEMQMRGVSGAHYRLAANAIGPETTADVRVGRSVPVSGHKVTPDYKLYLNPPSQALYNWVEPIVSDVEITSSCGSSVALDTAPDASASPATYSGSTWGCATSTRTEPLTSRVPPTSLRLVPLWLAPTIRGTWRGHWPCPWPRRAGALRLANRERQPRN